MVDLCPLLWRVSVYCLAALSAKQFDHGPNVVRDSSFHCEKRNLLGNTKFHQYRADLYGPACLCRKSFIRAARKYLK